MNLIQLRNIVRDLTKTNSSTADGGTIALGDPNFPDSTVNLYLTNAAHLMSAEITQSADDWDFQGDTAIHDLVANQREYIFPVDILKIKKIEISFDGQSWNRAKPIVESEIHQPVSTEQNIVARFVNNQPYFANLEKSFFIYSGTIPNVSGGIKIWYTKEIVGKDESTNPYQDLVQFGTTASPATEYPNIAAAYQEGLCYKTAKKFFEGYGDRARAEDMDNQFEKIIERMRLHYASRVEPRFLRIETGGNLSSYE